jgi:hypothetical protein
MSISNRSSQFPRQSIAACLVQTAYLPTEIPPAITTRGLAEWCRSNYRKLDQTREVLKSPTHYERFSAPRENGTRRDLALVHPSAQLLITLILTEHHQRIRRLIAGTQISRYAPEPDPENFRSFKGVQFRGLDAARSAVAQSRAFILSADISRFFYTVYTHSLEWAVRGKDVVKAQRANPRGKSRKAQKHWTQELDSALGLCQSRETFGIPVGPDTSRIVAEILLSGVHKQRPLNSLLSQARGYRLVDDFFLGFDTEQACREALTALRDALATFNLQLNEDKTFIVSARSIFIDRWRFELTSAEPRGSADARTEARNIRRYSELALYHSKNVGNATPVRWATRRLHGMTFKAGNFNLLLNILLRFGRDFPTCIDLVSTFIINNKGACSERQARTNVEEWVRAIFRSEAKQGHDFEVAWALVICGALGIPVSKVDFRVYSESACSVVFAILGLLNERHLLADPLSSFEWRAETKKSGLHGPHWLMFYEGVRRKWTKDRAMRAAVTSDPLMSQLLEANVTFLDASIFENVRISLERRRIIRIGGKALITKPEPSPINVAEESYEDVSLMFTALEP